MGRQSAFDRVRQLGDPRLLDHTGGAFERVRQAQQAAHDSGVGVSFSSCRVPCASHRGAPRLDTEILVWVLRHSATRSPGANQPQQVP